MSTDLHAQLDAAVRARLEVAESASRQEPWTAGDIIDGRLLPAGGETRTDEPAVDVEQQWEVTWRDIETGKQMHSDPYVDRAEAVRRFDREDEIWGHHARLRTRRVVTMPWVEVTEVDGSQT